MAFAAFVALGAPRIGSAQPLVGDFNGDGKSDVAVWYPPTGGWQVAISTGAQFLPASGPWLSGWAVSNLWKPLVGDFNGDGKSDIVVWNADYGDWQVAFSNGFQFVPQSGRWLYGWAANRSWVPLVGDFNGDGKSDIAAWYPANGDWQVAFSDGTKFVPQTGDGYGHWLFGWAQSSLWRPFTGDFNGDGRTDIVVWYPNTGDWQVAFSSGSRFVPQPGRGSGHWLLGWAQGLSSWFPLIGDVTGDRRSDVVVWYPYSGAWQAATSDGVEFVPQPGRGNGNWLFGWPQGSSWVAAAGDFDGDGKADVVVWRPDSGDWQVATSDGFEFVTRGYWLRGWAFQLR